MRRADKQDLSEPEEMDGRDTKAFNRHPYNQEEDKGSKNLALTAKMMEAYPIDEVEVR